MYSPSRARQALYSTVLDMRDDRELFLKNPLSDMTRARKISFKDTIFSVLNFGGRSIRSEMKDYFGLTRDRPSPSALIQQRNKLTPEVFPELFYRFNKALPFKRKLHGLQILACDGTDLNLLPDAGDTENFIRYRSGNGGYYQIHANALFDVGEQRYLDLELQPRPKMNETQALVTMLDRLSLNKNTLIICDRGYDSFNLMAHLMSKGVYFLIRAKNPLSPCSHFKHCSIPASGTYDIDIRRSITRSRKKCYLSHPEQYTVLHPGRPFDMIAADDKESVFDMDLRIVAADISENTTEYLITNLPRKKYPPRSLVAFYKLRWSEETSFLKLKYALSLSRMHSRKREFVSQEIYAKFIMYNFVSMVYSAARKASEKDNDGKNRKYKYLPSFQDAVGTIRFYLLNSVTNKKLITLLLMDRAEVKPGKHHPRKVRSQSAVPSNNRA